MKSKEEIWGNIELAIDNIEVRIESHGYSQSPYVTNGKETIEFLTDYVFGLVPKWIPISEADLIDQNAYWCYPSPKEEVESMSYIDGVFFSQTNEYEKSIITHVQPYVIPTPPQI